MRLIDAHALAAHFMCLPPDYYHTSYIVGEIMAAPTVHELDSVKEQPNVVRCKDCKYLHNSHICPFPSDWIGTDANWFCANGERR